MKKYLALIMALVFFIGISPQKIKAQTIDGTTYYVDSEKGEDTNDGKSKEAAFKTLNKVNEVTFEPGDKILFKSGEIFTGVFKPKGLGVEGAPIIVDKYGGDEKPFFIGDEASDYVILLENIEYYEINNLDISANYKTKGERKGIYIYAKDMGTLSHIYLKNLDIHDVKNNQVYTNNNSFKSTGGIIAQVAGNTVPTNFDDLRIEDCNIVNVDRSGMMLVMSSWANRTGVNYGSGRWFPSTNVVVENNNFENIGGDGVIMQQTDGALVQYNRFNGFAERNQNICYNCAAWSHNADNTVFQFNEGMNGNSILDGMPWDSDGYSNNTLFQYNYSHNNDGGAFLLISYGVPDSASGVSDMRDSTFRYNISENDRYALITFTNPLGDNEIYNNVFYVGPGVNVSSHVVGGDNNKELGLTLSNNIFYVDEKDGVSGRLNGNWNSKVTYDNNAYYSKVPGKITSFPNDRNAIKEDPKFVAAGTGEEGYKLKEDSPMINKGKYIFNHGDKDYYGNTLYNGVPDLGVHEYSNKKFEVPTEKEDKEVNLFNDPGFESGVLAPNGTKNAWAGYGSRKVTSTLENVKSGSYAAELGMQETGLNYEKTGLKPNTKYKAKIWAKIKDGNGPKGTVAVQNFENGNSSGKVSKVIDSTEYKEYELEFTTGSNSTYGWFFVYTSGNIVWVDDAELIEVEENLDLTILKEKLEGAKNKISEIEVSGILERYPDILINKLKSSIASAEEVILYEFAGISKETINKAIYEIDGALELINTFEASKVLGDLNGDGLVDIKDVAEGVKYIGCERKLFNSNWDKAKYVDFNYDGKIDFRDIKYLTNKVLEINKSIEKVDINEGAEEEVYKVGDTIEYTYKLSDLNDILAEDLSITFNNNVIKLKEVNTVINSRNTYHNFSTKEVEEGVRLILASAGEKYGLKGNQDIIKLTFEVIGEGRSNIIINDEAILSSGEKLESKLPIKENILVYSEEGKFGDINKDDLINIGDLGIISKYQGNIIEDNVLSKRSDLNKDGVVSILDIDIIMKLLFEN